MQIDPLELIENARIGIGRLKNIQNAAVFLNQRKLKGLVHTNSSKKADKIAEHDTGLRLWIQRNNKTFFYFFPIQAPEQQAEYIQSIDKNNQWRELEIDWPFEVINEDIYKLETSYKDKQISLIAEEEIQTKFENLKGRMKANTEAPLKKKVIDGYQIRYRHVENEEYLWTSGSKRSITHSGSRYLLDTKIFLMDASLCKGHEEAKYFNLDWSKISSWAEDWFSRYNTDGSSVDLNELSHTYFSHYSTKQLCFAVQSWITKSKSAEPFGDALLNSDHIPNKLVNLYDNPREAQVCGRRVWDVRGKFAKGIKYFDQGEWSLESREDIPTRIRGTQKYPEPTHCNLVFTPGISDRIDLMSKAKKGIWISSLETFDVDSDGVLHATALASSYSRNPNFVSPIGIVKIVAPLKQVLANIVDVGRELKWYHSIGSSDWLVSNEGIDFSMQ